MAPFTALADPTRVRIVELLAGGERTAGDIHRHFEASAPAISQHLRVLREAQLVRVRPDAQRRLYSLDPAGFEAIDAWMARLRRFWGKKLDRLESQLREAKKKRRS
ncbi:MAG: winged helix-turn-helix transcriptional regulator [Labilithrix sp.]|nr:winged helix-turn-helix transcriptional regulator [Labilithrix sp.]